MRPTGDPKNRLKDASVPEETVDKISIAEALMCIGKAAPPVIDARPMDELLGYGPDGLPE